MNEGPVGAGILEFFKLECHIYKDYSSCILHWQMEFDFIEAFLFFRVGTIWSVLSVIQTAGKYESRRYRRQDFVLFSNINLCILK